MLIAFNFRILIVFGKVQLWFVVIFRSATTEMSSETLSDDGTNRASHPLLKIIRSRE